jgi:hypothetical protein
MLRYNNHNSQLYYSKLRSASIAEKEAGIRQIFDQQLKDREVKWFDSLDEFKDSINLQITKGIARSEYKSLVKNFKKLVEEI